MPTSMILKPLPWPFYILIVEDAFTDIDVRNGFFIGDYIFNVSPLDILVGVPYDEVSLSNSTVSDISSISRCFVISY